MMDFERLQTLRLEYVNRQVTVEADRPELLRFKGKIGRVQAVNCNGKALVQFEGGADRAWYDIDLDYLSVVEPAEENAMASGKGGNQAQAGVVGQGVEYRPSALELARQTKSRAAAKSPEPPSPSS